MSGITSELEHLVNAGVGAVWMSPIFKSPMIDFGYDISDFYEIHDEYGTMEDFEELVYKAHSLGKKINVHSNNTTILDRLIIVICYFRSESPARLRTKSC